MSRIYTIQQINAIKKKPSDTMNALRVNQSNYEQRNYSTTTLPLSLPVV